MTKLKWVSLIVIPGILASVIIDRRAPENIVTTVQKKPEGVAIIMTGAAARLPQEAALLEELYNRGLMKNVVFISGVSSGALNAVMLNGILTHKITWTEYRNIIFSIRNKDLFSAGESNKLPVNPEPARNLLKNIVEERLGYHQIGDLPIMTVISITDMKPLNISRKVYRMSSRKINEETDTTLNLVDILMASTSVPLAFPPVRIQNVKTIPDVGYVDGGVGEDFIPYHALLEFEKFRGRDVEKIYIVSRKGDEIKEIYKKLNDKEADRQEKLDRLSVTFDIFLDKIMIRRLEDLAKKEPEFIMKSYVYIPDFNQNFLMFNFNDMKEQYLLTRTWARNHDPVPLGNYLLYYQDKKR